MEKPLYVDKTDSDQDLDSSEHGSEEEATVIKVHHQPTAKPGYNPNKYVHVCTYDVIQYTLVYPTGTDYILKLRHRKSMIAESTMQKLSRSVK